jgi:hypothetical protein
MLFDKQMMPSDHRHFTDTKRTNCNPIFGCRCGMNGYRKSGARCGASRSPRRLYRCVADRACKIAGWRAASRRSRPAGPFRPADRETPGVARSRHGAHGSARYATWRDWRETPTAIRTRRQRLRQQIHRQVRAPGHRGRHRAQPAARGPPGPRRSNHRRRQVLTADRDPVRHLSPSTEE